MFYASSIFMETVRLYGEMTDDVGGEDMFV